MKSTSRYSYLEILSNFTDKPLEGQLPDEKLRGLLVLPDFTEGDPSRAESLCSLDPDLSEIFQIRFLDLTESA